MTIIIISLLLLVSLLPNQTFTAHDGIVNGNEAKPHSRPYMVSVQSNGYHVCGGFLISDQFVLTAASCKMRGDLTVVVGAHDLTDNDLKPLKVQCFIPHPNYTSGYNYNDIMLLKLRKKICENDNVTRISLPVNGKADKMGCSVAGWGALWTNGPQSDRLIEAKTNILNDPVCESKWESRYKASQMICVYGSGGFCQWDSGSPLVCGNSIAVGIASFHDYCRCNSHEHPNVFTKISEYLPWIRKVIGK